MSKAQCVCCGHGVLSPALTGSILGVALIFGFFGLFCVGDVLAVVFGIVAVVLAFLPACIQFPRARGAKAMYFVVGGLAILSMIMKTFCLFTLADLIALILWAVAGIASIILACTAIEEVAEPSAVATELPTMSSPTTTSTIVTHIPAPAAAAPAPATVTEVFNDYSAPEKQV